eukprot:8187521-Pyramimonas_sp.AAC.2
MTVPGRVSAWRFGLSARTKAREFAQLLNEWHWRHGSNVRHVRGEWSPPCWAMNRSIAQYVAS